MRYLRKGAYARILHVKPNVYRFSFHINYFSGDKPIFAAFNRRLLRFYMFLFHSAASRPTNSKRLKILNPGGTIPVGAKRINRYL